MTGLRRELSLFDLTMIAVGSTIGSGIFLTPSLIAQVLPAPDWIFFGLTAVSVIVLRRKEPLRERPYRTLGYPATPLLFTTLAALFVGYTLLEKPAEAGAGLLFLALGAPVYFAWRRPHGTARPT